MFRKEQAYIIRFKQDDEYKTKLSGMHKCYLGTKGMRVFFHSFAHVFALDFVNNKNANKETLKC